jgi:hypothetical protein
MQTMNEPMTTKSPDLYAQLAYRMRESLGEFSDPNKGLETLVRELAAFKRAHLAQPAQAVDVGYDDALNDAGWAFIEAMPVQLPGPIFNNVKTALKAAIEKWIATRALTSEKAGRVGEIPLDDCVRSILGKPCFTLIHLANALRKDGHKIGHKAEDEQAVCLHWMLNLYLKHGTEWGKVATAEIERIHALPASPAPDKEGL